MRKVSATLAVTYLAATCLIGAAGACYANESLTATSDDASASGSEVFLTEAIQDAMTEVELGKLAQRNARSTGVNALGSRLARDHGRMNSILSLICRDKGVTVPTALDSEHRAIVDGLSAMSGTQFDIAYTALLVSNHADAITVFSEAAQGDDAALAAFAKSALPALREHKRLADSFQKMTAGYDVQPALAPAAALVQ
jgi:putative membrane protein